MDFFLMRSYLLGFAPLWKSLWIFKTVVAVKFFSQFVHCLHWQGFYPAHAFGSPPLTLLQKLLKAKKVAHRIWIRWRLRVLQKSKVPTVLDIALNSSHKDQWMRMFFLLFSAKQRQLEAAKIILCASTHLPSSKTRVTWGKSFLLLVQKCIFPVILENRQPNRMYSHIALVAW